VKNLCKKCFEFLKGFLLLVQLSDKETNGPSYHILSFYIFSMPNSFKQLHFAFEQTEKQKEYNFTFGECFIFPHSGTLLVK